jgi:hypothetical protein
MQLDWEKLFKRYVADDIKTPYFTAVERLTRTQARHELFLYALFMGVLFGVVGVASISAELPHEGAVGVPIYAVSVMGAAIVLGVTKQAWAAAYCASAPIAALLYFSIFGFHRNLGPWDKALLIVLVLLWLLYSWRVLSIVRVYPDMPEESR